MNHFLTSVRLIMMSHLSDCQEQASAIKLSFVRFLLGKYDHTDKEINPGEDWQEFETCSQAAKPGHKESSAAPGVEVLKVREAIHFILEIVGKMDVIISAKPSVKRSYTTSALINFSKSLLILYPNLDTVIDPRKEWRLFQERYLKTKVLTMHEILEWRNLYLNQQPQ